MSQGVVIDEWPGCRLWIDGVGAWLLWFQNTLTFGNGALLQNDPGRLRLMADLQSRHADWIRRGDYDVLAPHGETRLNGTPVSEETRLRSGDLATLGGDVELRYRLPSPLSRSAVWTIESGHRSVDGLDGIVTFSRACLLGPGDQHQIPCQQWEKTIVLYEWNGSLVWRENTPGAEPRPIQDGDVIGESDWRFRIEPLKSNESVKLNDPRRN